MNNDLKSTLDPPSDQTSADSNATERSKAPTFHVQTGVRAGGFYDTFYAWWEGVAEDLTGPTRPLELGEKRRKRPDLATTRSTIQHINYTMKEIQNEVKI